MKAKELMIKDIKSIKTNQDLLTACKKFKRYHVGFLVVKDRNKKLMGVVTDRDIVLAIAKGLPLSTKIKEVMSKEPIYMNENDPILKSVSIMANRQISRLLLVNDEGDVTGVLSLSNLALHDSTMEYVGYCYRNIKLPRPDHTFDFESYLDIDDYNL